MSRTVFTLSPPFARTLVNQVMSLLGRDVSLVDSEGTVLASYDPRLVQSQIRGAETAVQSKDVVDLPESSAVGFSISYNGSAIGAIIVHSDLKSVKEFIPMIRSLAELLVGQEAEHKMPGNLDQLLWQFFHSATDDEREKLVAEAKLIGVDLSKPRFAILIRVPGFAEKLAGSADRDATIKRVKDKVTREIAALFPTSNDNTVTYFGQDQFLLLKDGSRGHETLDLFRQKSPQMLANVDASAVAGIGSLYLGVEGLLTSYREAETALRLGAKLQQSSKVYFIDDLGLYIVFGNVGADKQVQVAKRLLKPLLQEEDLVKTLRAYFDQNLNLTQASEHLHIHRNTLIYRLNKIKDLIDLDPQTFEDAVQLKLALTLIDLE